MDPEIKETKQPTAITVAVFGPLTDIFTENRFRAVVALPAAAADLRTELIRQFPELTDHRFQMAVDDIIVGPETAVHVAEEIALLPAFAGG